MYEWTKALHVLSAFTFIVAHGASAAVALRIGKEREPERMRALLELSTATLGPLTWIALLVMLVSGIALGFLGAWWSSLWIWAGIVLFVVIAGVMTPFGAFRLNAIRSALGMSIQGRPAATPVPESELAAIVERYDPRPVTWVGGLGLAAIVLLMVLKPF